MEAVPTTVINAKSHTVDNTAYLVSDPLGAPVIENQ